MNQIEVNVTSERYAQLQRVASRAGLSVADYILAKSLPPDTEEQAAMESLDALLAPRIAEARAGHLSTKSVGDIASDVLGGIEG